MFSIPILILLTIQSSWAYLDEPYLPFDNTDSFQLTEDLPDTSPVETQRRSTGNNFLRFGRAGNKLEDYDDYSQEFSRPTRSGKIEKNDHFIRFGRAKQDFLRFGRDPHRITARDRGNYLRFGRSVLPDKKEERKRQKRDTFAASEDFKRGSNGGGNNFLRFGRNSNFMRFGRMLEANLMVPTEAVKSGQQEAGELLNKLKQLNESPLWQFLNDLSANLKQLHQQNTSKCSRDAQ